jgi:uncharacterized membrane protein SpoIIM required for sporulation/ABC-type transport system involved in multi-copper enzyme maturation permease subunit
MWSEIQPALAITKREVRDQLRDWRIIFPVLGLTVFFPFLMNFTAKTALDFVSKYGGSLIADRLVPFLFMVVGFFPISVSLVIALESFVGEKERGSIEPLLNTPLKDWQIYLGKLLSSTIPPLLSSYLGMTVYLVGLAVTKVTLPGINVLLQLVALTTVQAVVMVAGAVIVSTQTTSVRASNLLASFIVIPSALLIQGESVVIFWGDYTTLWWVVFGMTIFSILLVRVGLAHFRREELLGREIDVLNFRWGWKVFYSSFISGADSLGNWYRSVFIAIKANWIPIVIVSVMFIFGVYIGYLQTFRFKISLDQAGVSNIENQLVDIMKNTPIYSSTPIMGYFWQNLRVLILALPLGLFTFGVVGVLPGIASLGIMGYLMGLLNQAGLTPVQFFTAFILPHGIFEIPAAIIATASVFRSGALVATPDPNRSVSEIILQSLAQWVKIMLGVVIPLLLVAACVEAWVTPRIAYLLLR